MDRRVGPPAEGRVMVIATDQQIAVAGPAEL
jgi:hypothetical protein